MFISQRQCEYLASKDKEFDYNIYINSYPDLKKQNWNIAQAYRHWKTYGRREGRYSTQYPVRNKCRPPLRKICVVQPIFCPDEVLLKKNINSIKSQINIKDTRCDFYYAGWCKNESYCNKLDTVINEHNPIKYIKQDKNYGKAYNVNELLKDIPQDKYDMLITFDSDIIFKDNNFISTIDRIQQNIVNIGLLAPNMEEAPCHSCDNFSKMKINNDIITFNDRDGSVGRERNCGISGGCLCIDFKIWKQINGYKVMGVYAGEDAQLLNDIASKQRCACIIEDLYIIHPKDENSAYNKWKGETCQRLWKEGRCNVTHAKLLSENEKANSFWKMSDNH